MSKTSCGECLYWKRFAVAGERPDADMDRGVCKRYPPVLDAVYAHERKLETTDSALVWVQPITDSDEYCGEWASATTEAV